MMAAEEFLQSTSTRTMTDDSDSMTCRPPLQFLVETPSGKTTTLTFGGEEQQQEDDASSRCRSLVVSYEELLVRAFLASVAMMQQQQPDSSALSWKQLHNKLLAHRGHSWKKRLLRQAYLVHGGRPLTARKLRALMLLQQQQQQQQVSSHVQPLLLLVQLKLRIVGGIDRQNRVGSKFGGGGVSSSQQSERERKERLKQLALESIDLAKDPYLVKSHVGSYECKLCLTLHRDEANYLAHTQGKKHQQGLARRAHLDQLKQEKEGTAALPLVDSGTVGSAALSSSSLKQAPSLLLKTRVIKIGRPAYQVYKSRDPETHQRCLSFELAYPEISDNIQPRHRFMSAFEQRVESPPDRRYQYLLFAAEPYETVAFKIPNDPIDKGENRFVTHWDEEGKKFTVSLYFVKEEGEK